MKSILVFLSFLYAVIAGAPSSKTISVSTDTNVKGFEGLNLKLAIPFKFDGNIIGFRYKLNRLKKLPDSLFAKKSLPIGDGEVTIDADYELKDNILSISSKWASEKLGLSIYSNGDSKDFLQSVGISKKQNVDGRKITLTGNYDPVAEKLGGSVALSLEDTTAELSYDTSDKDLVLHISHQYDSKNILSPTISLSSGKASYGWTRLWQGGSVDTKYYPGDKTVIEWKDKGANGLWKTKATIPSGEHQSTKLAVTHDWIY